MIVEILTIGDELCRGEIVDTNSSWLASRLWEAGLTVGWMTSCRDDRADIARALRAAAGRAHIILSSGGLGPTEDDLTVDVICDVLGVQPVEHEASRARMVARFEVAGYKLTPNNARQVRVPAGAEVFVNPAGLAPGFGVQLDRARLFVMPGVPREVHALFESAIGPRVVALAATGDRIVKRKYRVFGKGESHLDHALAGLVDRVVGASIHYQVLFPETLIKLVVRDPVSVDAAGERLAALDAELRARLGDLVYGEDEDGMAVVLGRVLAARRATLAVAESCTGGMLGSLITDVPGSSAWFVGGWIAYANDVKTRELGVREETIRAHGAVSREAVIELAEAARARAGTTYGAAISGVAGPAGGTPDKPVGTVHVAVCGPGGGRHKTFVYPGARDQVRRLAAYWAMSLLVADLRDLREQRGG